MGEKVQKSMKAYVRALIDDIAEAGRLMPRREAVRFYEQKFAELYRKYPSLEMFIMNQELELYSRLNMQEKIVEVADRLLEIDPYHYMAQLLKGRALGLQGKTDEAVRIFESLLTQNLNRNNRRMVYLHYIKLLRTRKRWGEVMAVLDRALGEFPDDVLLLTNRVIVLKSIGEYDRALELLERLPQDDPYVRMEKSHVYVCLMRPEEAKKELEAARYLFSVLRKKDRRLRNERERRSVGQRLEALQVAIMALEGEVEKAQSWADTYHSAFPAANIVNATLSAIYRMRSGKVMEG